MTNLYLRNLLFTILQPGVVAGLIPYWLLKRTYTEGSNFSQILGSFIGFFGVVIMLACIKRFATEGNIKINAVCSLNVLDFCACGRFNGKEIAHRIRAADKG